MIIYNLSQHIAGDTWRGIPNININRNDIPLDLTDAHVEFHVKFQIDAPTVFKISSDDGSIIILNPPTDGDIQIPPQIVDIPPANYIWSLKITLPTGEIGTFVSGNWNIVKTA
jgi:hypothetical protein